MRYAHRKAIETRQREALAYQLRQITEADDYFTTLGDTYFSLYSNYQAGRWPAVIVLPKGGSGDLGGSTGGATFTVKYDVLVILKVESGGSVSDEAADLEKNLFRENVKCDIATRIGEAYALYGEDGVPTCYKAWVSGWWPLYTLLKQSVTAVQIEITAEYGHMLTDGTQYA